MKVSCLFTVPLLWTGLAVATACKPKPSPSSASPSASPSVVCQNIVQAPDFDPASDWIAEFVAIGAPSDNSWAQVTPCGDYDSCVQITAHDDTGLSIQGITYPYTGTYTASLKYMVINAGDGIGNLNFGLNANDPGVTTSAVSATWLTYTTQFTANAGNGGLYLAFTGHDATTIRVTDVQIIACES